MAALPDVESETVIHFGSVIAIQVGESPLFAGECIGEVGVSRLRAGV